MKKIILFSMIGFISLPLIGCFKSLDGRYVASDLKEVCSAKSIDEIPGFNPLGDGLYEIKRSGEPKRYAFFEKSDYSCSISTANKNGINFLTYGTSIFTDFNKFINSIYNGLSNVFFPEFVTVEKNPSFTDSFPDYDFYLSDDKTSIMKLRHNSINRANSFLAEKVEIKLFYGSDYSYSSERKNGMSFFEFIELKKDDMNYKQRVAQLSKEKNAIVNEKNQRLSESESRERRQLQKDRAEAFNSTFKNFEQDMKKTLSTFSETSSPSNQQTNYSSSPSYSNPSNSTYSPKNMSGSNLSSANYSSNSNNNKIDQTSKTGPVNRYNDPNRTYTGCFDTLGDTKNTVPVGEYKRDFFGSIYIGNIPITYTNHKGEKVTNYLVISEHGRHPEWGNKCNNYSSIQEIIEKHGTKKGYDVPRDWNKYITRSNLKYPVPERYNYPK